MQKLTKMFQLEFFFSALPSHGSLQVHARSYIKPTIITVSTTCCRFHLIHR